MGSLNSLIIFMIFPKICWRQGQKYSASCKCYVSYLATFCQWQFMSAGDDFFYHVLLVETFKANWWVFLTEWMHNFSIHKKLINSRILQATEYKSDSTSFLCMAQYHAYSSHICQNWITLHWTTASSCYCFPA